MGGTCTEHPCLDHPDWVRQDRTQQSRRGRRCQVVQAGQGGGLRAIVLILTQGILKLLVPQEIQRPSCGVAQKIGGETAVEATDRTFVAEDRAGDADRRAQMRMGDSVELEARLDDIEGTAFLK